MTYTEFESILETLIKLQGDKKIAPSIVEGETPNDKRWRGFVQSVDTAADQVVIHQLYGGREISIPLKSITEVWVTEDPKDYGYKSRTEP